MEPQNEILDADITFISLVKAGANQKTIIWKAAKHPADPTLIKTVQIKKIDDEKHMVYGIVYAPNQVDTDGDFASAAAIEKMAYNFMKNERTTNVDKQHDFDPDEGFVAESWITKSGDPLFGDEPVGSWAVGIKVEKAETWQQIKKGEIQALSMAGTAEKQPVQKDKTAPKEGIMSKLAKWLKNTLKKDFNEEFATDKILDMVWAFMDSVWKTLDDNDLDLDQKKTEIYNSVSQFREKLMAENLDKTAISSDTVAKIEALTKELIALKKEITPEDDMETKDVQKIIDDTINPIKTSLDEIQKKLKPADPPADPPAGTPAELTVKELADRIEKLEKVTPGSALKKEDDPTKTKSKGIPFIPEGLEIN